MRAEDFVDLVKRMRRAQREEAVRSSGFFPRGQVMAARQKARAMEAEVDRAADLLTSSLAVALPGAAE